MSSVHQLVKLVVLLHGAKDLARVRHLVDHVPDLLPLHAGVGTGDIGPNHANGLVLDLQHPDFVAEGDVLREIESIVDVQQFGDVMAFDRFLGVTIRNHVLHDARGQLAEGQTGSNPAAAVPVAAGAQPPVEQPRPRAWQRPGRRPLPAGWADARSTARPAKTRMAIPIPKRKG